MAHIVSNAVTVMIPGRAAGPLVFVRLRDVNLAGERNRVMKVNFVPTCIVI